MAKEDTIEVTGVVLESLPNAIAYARTATGKDATARTDARYARKARSRRPAGVSSAAPTSAASAMMMLRLLGTMPPFAASSLL